WKVFTKADGLPGNDILFVDEGPEGTLWVSTCRRIACLDQGRFVQAPEQGDRPVWVFAAVVDRRGGYWIASSSGLFRAGEASGAKDGSRVGLSFERVAPRSITGSGGVRSVLEDREGSIWAGTNGHGLLRLHKRRFRSLALPPKVRHKPPQSLAADDSGGLWIGLRDHHLMRWRDDEWAETSPSSEIDRIDSMATGRDGTLWIAHDAGWLSKLRNGQFVHYRHGLGHISAILDGRQAGLWLATENGLSTFRDEKFNTLAVDSGLTSEGNVGLLAESPDGTVWLASNRAITAYRGGEVTPYATADGLPAADVRSMHTGGDGSLWIATYGAGLVRLADGKLIRYTTSDGLPDNSLGKILGDDEGHLWINSNRGVFRVGLEELNAFARGRISMIHCRLLRTGEGNSAQGVRAPDGRLWFPTIDGLTTVGPGEFATNAVPPLVAIEQVVADGAVIDHRTSVRVPPGRGRLEIRFSGLSFVEPEDVRFRYLLEGYEQDWIEAGTRRTAYYTNIPPDDYRFRVMACNNDGVWSETETALAVTVLPHFYETAWFLALVGITLVATALVGHGVRTRNIRARATALQGEISQRREAEQVLRVSEERYRNLFELAPIPIWEEDFTEVCAWLDELRSEGIEDLRAYLREHPEALRQALPLVKVVEVNEAAVRLFGAEYKEELRDGLSAIFTDDTYRTFAEELAAIWEGRRQFEAECTAVSLKGERIDDVLLWFVPDVGGQLDFSKVIVTVLDITDRKQADAALRDRERQFRELIESAPDAILLTDPKGMIAVVNAGTEAMFGYRREELVGQFVEMLMPERYRAHHVALRERFVRDPIERSLCSGSDLIGLRKNGSEFPVAINLGHIRTARGPFVVSTIRDETDRQRLEGQLRQAQKLEAVGTLASGIAHDFSNALTAIFGCTDLARRTLPEDHPAHEALEMIEQSVRQASGVTNSLLTFTHRGQVEKATVNLGVVLGEAAQLLRRMLPATIEIITDVAPDPPAWVLADATQLHQILMNLAVNSRDAMPDGGTLRVVLEAGEDAAARSTGANEAAPDRKVSFFVADTGVGMPEEVRSRIFEPFYTTKQRGRGTGLGMSLIHGIVSNHGGAIEVESRVGSGTKVSVSLPRCPAPQPPDAPPAGSGSDGGLPGRGELILVVEDNSHVRSIIRSALNSNGYVVLEAGDGVEAQSALASRGSGIRLVLLDLDLPKLSGLSVLEDIRRRPGSMAAMVITGDVDVDIQKELQQGERLLRKPFSVPELVQAVQASLATAGEEPVSC
ncbi:MAG: PAS domain S-box protein, partial [bacterium]|nr:PAS domain S-box protein [bacterium]